MTLDRTYTEERLLIPGQRLALTDCSSKTMTADQLEISQGVMVHEGAASIGCWLKSCGRQAAHQLVGEVTNFPFPH